MKLTWGKSKRRRRKLRRWLRWLAAALATEWDTLQDLIPAPILGDVERVLDAVADRVLERLRARLAAAGIVAGERTTRIPTEVEMFGMRVAAEAVARDRAAGGADPRRCRCIVIPVDEPSGEGVPIGVYRGRGTIQFTFPPAAEGAMNGAPTAEAPGDDVGARFTAPDPGPYADEAEGLEDLPSVGCGTGGPPPVSEPAEAGAGAAHRGRPSARFEAEVQAAFHAVGQLARSIVNRPAAEQRKDWRERLQRASNAACRAERALQDYRQCCRCERFCGDWHACSCGRVVCPACHAAAHVPWPTLQRPGTVEGCVCHRQTGEGTSPRPAGGERSAAVSAAPGAGGEAAETAALHPDPFAEPDPLEVGP